MIPWKYHNLTPRDVSGTLLRDWSQYASIAGTTPGLVQFWTVPADSAALLFTWSVAGHGQTGPPAVQPIYAFLTVAHAPIANNPDHFRSYAPFLAYGPTGALAIANTDGFVSVPLGNILLAPGARISINAVSINLSSTLWTADVSIGAVLIPRGDAAYV